MNIEFFKEELYQKTEMAKNLSCGGVNTAEQAKEQWEEVYCGYLQLAGLKSPDSTEGIEYRRLAVAAAFEAGGQEKAQETLLYLIESGSILPKQFEELKNTYCL